MSESLESQSTDQSTDSANRVARTDGRTHEDELVQMRDIGCESNAGETSKIAAFVGGVGSIAPIVWGRTPRFAEVNGAKVIVARDLPESILRALAALVDAVTQEFGDVEAQRRAAEADQPKPLCRWHPGQLADYCGPCRSEEIGAA